MKALSTDLDGTLLDQNHRISDANRQALARYQQGGRSLILATGRHYLDASHIAKTLENTCAIISTNGAQIHDSQGRLLQQDCLSADIAQHAIAISQHYQVHRNVYLHNEWWTDEQKEGLQEAHPYSDFRYRCKPLRLNPKDRVLKLFFIAEKAILEPLRRELITRLKGQATVVYAQDTFLEVMASGVSKGAALKRVLSDYSLSPRDTIAFGDSMNDLEMLQLVGHPVVMANGQDELRSQLENYYQAKSHRVNGVADYLLQLI